MGDGLDRLRFLGGPLFALTLVVATAASSTAADVPPGTDSPSDKHSGSFFDFWNPETSPFIPIPEIGTDPNSGTTYGLLPIFLRSENGQISRILAPDVTYNSQLGYGGHFRILSYPSQDEQWSVVAGGSRRVERGVDGLYQTGILRQSDWSFTGHVVYDRSATGRFFGFGNQSQHAGQSNFTEEQGYVQTTIARNFGPNWQVSLDLRPRYVQIEHGTFNSLPSTNVVFPGLVGLGNEHEFFGRTLLAYDTRDSTVVPTQGTELVGFAGATDKAFLSSVSYSRFGIDARHFEPIDQRFTFAGHIALHYMPVGDNVPFWALNTLGGDRSILAEDQPLRGFGADRFIDRNLFSSSVELRSKVYELNLFTTDINFEMAPFVDAGRVFHALDDNPLDHLHVAGGLGLRAVAKPFVVGYVDVGYGGEGIAIFSGINYPF